MVGLAVKILAEGDGCAVVSAETVTAPGELGLFAAIAITATPRVAVCGYVAKTILVIGEVLLAKVLDAVCVMMTRAATRRNWYRFGIIIIQTESSDTNHRVNLSGIHCAKSF